MVRLHGMHESAPSGGTGPEMRLRPEEARKPEATPRRLPYLEDVRPLLVVYWEPVMTLNGHTVTQTTVSERTRQRAERYMSPWGASERDKPGYWVKLTARIYAYREHTGDITFWRS